MVNTSPDTYLKATGQLPVRMFEDLVLAATASIATGWNEPVPGRDFSPAEDQRLFTAHSG